MAQPIAFSQYAVITGKTVDTDLAMTLAINPVPSVLLSTEDFAVQTNFINNTPLSNSLSQRILLLLLALWPRIEQAIADQEVYLLLPEFSGVDNAELQQLLQAIMRQFPTLLRCDRCKVFPYGRAAALMAYAAANARLSNKSSSQIWLLAVDSLAITSRLDFWCAAQDYQPNAVASEAAIAVCLTTEDIGLTSLLHAADAHIADTNQANDTALGQLLLHVADTYPEKLNNIMLPDTGEQKLTSVWLEQYKHLHGVVDSNTQFEFPGYCTGELGTTGGLYRLLYIYLSFIQQRITTPILQCEIAERSYRAVSVFNYQSAS